jgi:hypothetical protein
MLHHQLYLIRDHWDTPLRVVDDLLSTVLNHLKKIILVLTN